MITRPGGLRKALLPLVAVLALLAAACSGGGGTQDGPDVGSATTPPGLTIPAGDWATDFSIHSVPLEEFISGGPPRDGIPPIDDPVFTPVAEDPGEDREPVIALEVNEVARAYPIRILMWHEIVNDEIGGVPVAVTFCPLCNTAVAFERSLDDQVLRFGTTGNLRLSDLVMWDDHTESWWQQFSGEAIVGTLTGRRLGRLPSTLISLGEFRARHPEGEVLSERTGHERPYGENPYTGYDDVDSPPFLMRNRAPDGRLSPKERVVALEGEREYLAIPFDILREQPVMRVDLDGAAILVWWRRGTASALDAREIARGRDVGSVVVFDAVVAGRPTSFEPAGDLVRDRTTGSLWDREGRAVAGPASGARLRAVPHDTPFWFAVAAFRPDVRVLGLPAD